MLYVVNYSETLSKNFIVDANSEQEAQDRLFDAVMSGEVDLTLNDYLEDSGVITVDGPPDAMELELVPPLDEESSAAIGQEMEDKGIGPLFGSPVSKSEVEPKPERTIAQVAQEAREATRNHGGDDDGDDGPWKRQAYMTPEPPKEHTIANISKKAREAAAKQSGQQPHPSIPPKQKR